MSPAAPPAAGRGTMSLLERLGLHRPELRAWAMYDWANSVFMTVIVLVFPIYFVAEVGADLGPGVADERFAWSTTMALTIVALVSPALGAFADITAAKKKLLAATLIFGVTATAFLYTVERGEWAWGLLLFILANIGISASFVFYESLLPHIASPAEIDRVSAAGYAVGYLGGGLPLALTGLWIKNPAAWGFSDGGSALRFAFLASAGWWAVFSIPLFLRVREPRAVLEKGHAERSRPVRSAFARLGGTFRELRNYRQAFLLLLAFLLYNDGIQTIIRMATPYGASIGLSHGDMIAALVITQFVGIPFAFLFGALTPRVGVKRILFIPIVVYVVITILGYRMTTAREFYVLAFLVGTVMGGSQSISRSLFATMIPRHQSAEFFGFWSVFEKFAGVLGPFVFAAVIHATGSSRPAILALIVFFVVGGLLLSFVDVEEGRAHARAAEENAGSTT